MLKVFIGFSLCLAGQSPLELTKGLDLETNKSIERNINFWIEIYSKYTSKEGLVHDAKYIDHVYEVVQLDGNPITDAKIIQRAKQKWKALLLSVHRKRFKPESMTVDEKKVYDLFSDVKESNRFLDAAYRKRLRFQQGQRDQFLEGLIQSGRYIQAMEAIFKREGLPSVLTRLPFVESSFNLKARSKVGASGVWQFMRSTGRLYLRITDAVDERNDPLLATEAAAKLLRLNYESLGTWPLAITAYNYGRKGIMRAVRRVGVDDLHELIMDFRSRSFGFASSNFFAEFMAATEVDQHTEKYFGKIVRDRPLEFIEMTVFDYIELRQLCRWLGLSVDQIRDLNAALSASVYQGRLLVPAGYRLRVPYYPTLGIKEDAYGELMRRYSEIPGVYKLKRQRYMSLKKRS